MTRLHGYWRSGASYRVRIALNLKNLTYSQISYDLRTGEQRHPRYRALNPQMLVPALEAGDEVLTQSPAILEWIEECHPMPALLPSEPTSRAIVRSMAATIACDIHPLNNLRVLNALRQDFGATEAQVSAWIARWIKDGFNALEEQIGRVGNGFAFGDTPTLADVCLVPQAYSAERFGVTLAPYPKLAAVVQAARALPAFVAAEPRNQLDADRA